MIRREDWLDLLTTWSDEALLLLQRVPATIDGLETDALAKGTLLYDPATKSQLSAAEDRLGLTLPPSYRTFLECTNGWLQLGADAEHARLLSVSEIDHLPKALPLAFEILNESGIPSPFDAEYLDYGPNQSYTWIKPDQFRTALAISEHVDSAFYALNPSIRDADEEWEAWVHRFMGGSHRCRSFFDLMRLEKATCLENLRQSVASRLRGLAC